MKHFDVEITGKTPLLMHWDDIDWADRMEAWKNDPKSKKGSKAGDDRSPAWRWIGSTYRDEANEYVSMPSENLMKTMMEGSALVPVPGGKSGKTFKAQSQSGMMITETGWRVLIGGEPVPLAPIDALLKEEDFAVHKETVKSLGFSLFVKRAKVGASKHVRVRPRFDEWSLKGQIRVWDKQLTLGALQDILNYAGSYKGLGDWRPSSPSKPGYHGTFDAVVREAK